jgi:hypothetical protein
VLRVLGVNTAPSAGAAHALFSPYSLRVWHNFARVVGT